MVSTKGIRLLKTPFCVVLIMTSRRQLCSGHVSYKILVGKHLLNCPFERLGSTWDVYIKEIGYEAGKWMQLPRVRVQFRALILAVLNFRVLLLHT